MPETKPKPHEEIAEVLAAETGRDKEDYLIDPEDYDYPELEDLDPAN